MCFTKVCLEHNLCLLDSSKMIPCLDIFSVLSSLVDDAAGLQYCLRVRIWKMFYVTIFKKVFNFVENIVDLGERFMLYFCHLFFKTVQITQ